MPSSAESGEGSNAQLTSQGSAPSSDQGESVKGSHQRQELEAARARRSGKGSKPASRGSAPSSGSAPISGSAASGRAGSSKGSKAQLTSSGSAPSSGKGSNAPSGKGSKVGKGSKTAGKGLGMSRDEQLARDRAATARRGAPRQENNYTEQEIAYYKMEAHLAHESGLRWSARGPRPEYADMPKEWKGGTWRPNAKRWAKRGGADLDERNARFRKGKVSQGPCTIPGQ